MNTFRLADVRRAICGFDYLRRRGLDVSPSTLARMEKRGTFPARIHPSGGRKVAWVVEEVDAYFNTLTARAGAA